MRVRLLAQLLLLLACALGVFITGFVWGARAAAKRLSRYVFFVRPPPSDDGDNEPTARDRAD